MLSDLQPLKMPPRFLRAAKVLVYQDLKKSSVYEDTDRHDSTKGEEVSRISSADSE